MNIKPLADRVIIEPIVIEQRTPGGLIIPFTDKDKPLEGKVLAVGPGTKEIAMEVKVGDKVLYGNYSGTKITIDGKELLLIPQEGIWAIVK